MWFVLGSQSFYTSFLLYGLFKCLTYFFIPWLFFFYCDLNITTNVLKFYGFDTSNFMQYFLFKQWLKKETALHQWLCSFSSTSTCFITEANTYPHPPFFSSSSFLFLQMYAIKKTTCLKLLCYRTSEACSHE